MESLGLRTVAMVDVIKDDNADNVVTVPHGDILAIYCTTSRFGQADQASM